MTNRQERMNAATRIVVKLGTSTLSFPNGKMNFTRLEKLIMILSDLMSAGKEIILVTSGAIGVGAGMLKMDEPPEGLVPRQALAAIGQAELIRIYQKFFNDYHQRVAQVLLTPEGLDEQVRRTNAQNTLLQLISMKIIPVINENDAVSTVEIQFGDNDTLAAKVAGLVNADLLIILSDIDGLYSADPKTDPTAQILPEVEEITQAVESAASGSGSSFARGGMASKIQAAKICFANGIDAVICNGEHPQNILKVTAGESVGTLFLAPKSQII